jgi:hypothetical protein
VNSHRAHGFAQRLTDRARELSNVAGMHATVVTLERHSAPHVREQLKEKLAQMIQVCQEVTKELDA